MRSVPGGLVVFLAEGVRADGKLCGCLVVGAERMIRCRMDRLRTRKRRTVDAHRCSYSGCRPPLSAVGPLGRVYFVSMTAGMWEAKPPWNHDDCDSWSLKAECEGPCETLAYSLRIYFALRCTRYSHSHGRQALPLRTQPAVSIGGYEAHDRAAGGPPQT